MMITVAAGWLWLGRHVRTVLPLVLSIVVGLQLTVAAQGGEKPNIVIILADDLGYGDVRCLNAQSRIATPHMDRIAREGVVFTDAHSGSAVCTPTRYGLLTGRYAWRSVLQSGVLGGLSPRLIEADRWTLPALLRKHGYFTAAVGKWHLGLDWVVQPGKTVTRLGIEPREQVWNVDYARPIANGPTAVGFDYYYGISASLDMVPYTYIENDRVTILPTEDRDFPLYEGRAGPMCRKGPAAPGFQTVDVLPTLVRKAVQVLHARAAAAPDQPQPFLLYLPLTAPHTPIAPAPEWLGQSGVSPYADFVMQTDAAVGTVLAALDELQLASNTLVIVTSDNGCSPLADYDELQKHGHNPSYHFRGTKADIFEGGHRVPLLVRWPGHAPAGRTSAVLTCLTDCFATCAEILGQEIPVDAAEDSVSFLGALTGDSPPDPARAVVHHSINGSFAIRQGDWKLAFCADSGGWSEPRPGQPGVQQLPRRQLYNLPEDIGERRNLVAERPAIVERLARRMQEIVDRGRSTPGPNQTNAVPVKVER